MISGKRERFLIRRAEASRRDASVLDNVDEELIGEKGESSRNLPFWAGINGPTVSPDTERPRELLDLIPDPDSMVAGCLMMSRGEVSRKMGGEGCRGAPVAVGASLGISL
jgi:hypothetical protein